MKKTVALFLFFAMIFTLFACGEKQAEAEPTATPTLTPEPTPTPTPVDIFPALCPTINMSFAELVGDNGNNDYPKGFPTADTYKVIVDLTYQVVLVYTKDSAGEYTVPARYMLCSSGVNNATPAGTFEMDDHRVRFSVFASDGRYGQYWTQITKRFYFHTILYSKKNAANYLEDTYEKLGSPDSHGCVRLTVPDARWIFYNIAPGTVCEIRKGLAGDAETAAIKEKIKLAAVPEQRLSLVKGEIPNTDTWTLGGVLNEVKFVQGKPLPAKK